MKRVQQGFTLIELMIVVAIVGILAAIALPAYQDFVVRSKMSEGTAALGACKTSVTDYTSTHAGTLPADSAAAGCSTTSSQFVNGGVAVLNGVMTMATQNTGSTLAGVAKDCTLQMTPVQAGAGGIEITSWTATSSNCDTKYVPSSFR
jgi:type IV pilus assembly protein PilA